VLNFFSQAIEQLRTLPGVQTVGAVNTLPFNGPHAGTSLEIEGRPKLPPGQKLSTGICVTDANYFAAMQIPLKSGRLFTEQEAKEMRHVVVVSETFARKNLPGENPLGKRVTINMKDENVPTEIIGVVGDTKHAGLDTDSREMAYWPQPELVYTSMTLVIRTQGDPLSVAPGAREVIRNIDPEQPIGEVNTMAGLLATSVAKSRFSATLLGGFLAGGPRDGGGRHLRRDVLLGATTHARNRAAHGFGRAAKRRAAAGHQAGRPARVGRRGPRSGSFVWFDAAGRESFV
jgi:hypothetical protein